MKSRIFGDGVNFTIIVGNDNKIVFFRPVRLWV